jgi:ABC-type antimicrobial peptide transport system permease subunit
MRYFAENMKLSQSGQPEWGITEIETTVDYPKFMKQPIIEGRFFSGYDKTEAVINLAARNLFEDRQVIGKSITCLDRGQTYTIVGVIDDYRPEIVLYDNRISSFEAVIYLSVEHPEVIYVNPKGSHREASDFIMKIIRQYLPENIDFQLQSLRKTLVGGYAESIEIIFRLILAFSIISLIIGLSGVYSSVSLNTARRRKEIAIRKVYGAAMGQIVRMFLRSYLLLLLVVSVPAYVIVYAAVGVLWLELFPYQVSLPFWLFFPVFVFPATGLVATVLHHLWQVARQNPAEVVKSV